MQKSNQIKAFLSYSWGDEGHNDWVRNLADRLTKYGIYVYFDQYDLESGKNMLLFMEKAIEGADKVLMILTPNYSFKAHSRAKGVGYEYSLISQELYEIQKDNNKFIPILREGSISDSIPGIIKPLVFHNMSNDETFETDLFKLVKRIYNKTEVIRPQLGDLPDFDKEIDPIIERSNKLKLEIELKEKRKRILEWEEGASLAWKEIRFMFDKINEKAKAYKEKTSFFFKSENNDHRCVLIAEEGITVNFYWQCPQYKYLENSSIIVTIWDGPLSLKNDIHYIDGEPKQLNKAIYEFDLDSNLNPTWKTENGHQISTNELVNQYFSKLFDFISEVKRKKY